MNRTRVVIGAALIWAGLVFVLEQLGYLHAGEILGHWWPAVIVTLGLVSFSKREQVGPAVVTLVGALLLLLTLGVITAGMFWPVVLGVIGLSLLVTGVRPPHGAGQPGHA